MSTILKFPLPEDRLPMSWKEEDRMRFICAPFRHRSANPEEWVHKYEFWHELIHSWSNYHALCCFSLLDLNNSFKRNTKKIICLSTVWLELYRNGEIISLSEFLKEPCHTWSGWIIDIVFKKSTNWMFSILKRYFSVSKFDETEKYIYLITVKELAELILTTISNKNENKILSLRKLTENCIRVSGNERITEENIKLALIWLRFTKQAIFKYCNEDCKNDLLIKISLKHVNNITEIDEGIYKLTEHEIMLINSIEELEKEQKNILFKAKLLLNDGMKQSATTLLKKKHLLGKCIKQRSVILQNVQKLLSNINDAHYDKNTLAAYEAGYKALKKFEKEGLIEEKIKDTLDNLSEVFEEFDEIKSALAQTISTDEPDFNFEKDLAEIMENSNENYSKNENDLLADSKEKIPNLSKLDLFDLSESKCERNKVKCSKPAKIY